MNIVLIGATGGIGSRVLDEALRRGHAVTATSRDPANKLAGPHRHDGEGVNTAESPRRPRCCRRHDAVVVSVKWNEADIHQVLDAIRNVGREALPVRDRRRQPVPQGRPHPLRAHGRERHPAADLEARGARLRGDEEGGDLDWTAISPAASIQPGERTGKFRLGLDHLIEDDEGESRISREDFAIAILDELEKPSHVRKRFTAGY